ncbi:MAG: ATPase [Chloroflexi bacterium]|nr:MAG: ATPase [Chloroflexota bacterium]
MAAASESKTKVTLPSDREILITREFDAPRDLVFKAMTDPDLIGRWWGPRNYETVVDKMDVRPGGTWRFIHRQADGTEFAFRGEYREVVPPERIVQTFEFEPMAGHISVETATFTERDGRTLLTVRSLFASKEDRDGMIQSGMEKGLAETHDRFAELLAELREEARSGAR